MLVAAKHAKACFLSLRDRPTCVQNACAFSQPLGHLTVNCCRTFYSLPPKWLDRHAFSLQQRFFLALFEGSQLYTTKPAKAMHMHFSGDIINPVLD